MDASELAQKLLEWEKKKRDLDVLEEEIKASVLELGQTQTVGNVRVSYRSGRKTYNYEQAVIDAAIPFDELTAFQKITMDYKAVCDHYNIRDVSYKVSDPSVSIKLLGGT